MFATGERLMDRGWSLKCCLEGRMAQESGHLNYGGFGCHALMAKDELQFRTVGRSVDS